MSLFPFDQEYLKANSKCSSCARWRIETAITWGKSQEHRKFRTGLSRISSLKSLPLTDWISIDPTRDAKNRNFEFINIGYWSPMLGFVCQELAFPHIEHHFRNITMDIVTVHVSL